MCESHQYAQALARHVKAALMHLRQAEDLVELAGVDIYASERDVPAAGLIRAAGEVTEDLDTWAINNARASGAASAETYAHTERWCHAKGGSLPAGSWPQSPATPDLVASEGLRQLSAPLDHGGDREATRARLRAELESLHRTREAWEKTARVCVCPPGLCSRRDPAFGDRAGDPDPSGCMVCAELDPGRPCYAAVLRSLAARGGTL
jgi:hypothetical protein